MQSDMPNTCGPGEMRNQEDFLSAALTSNGRSWRWQRAEPAQFSPQYAVVFVIALMFLVDPRIGPPKRAEMAMNCGSRNDNGETLLASSRTLLPLRRVAR